MQRRIGQSFCNMREACSLVWSVLVLLFRSRVSLEAEILILRHQLNIKRRHLLKRVAFTLASSLHRRSIPSSAGLSVGSTKGALPTAAPIQARERIEKRGLRLMVPLRAWPFNDGSNARIVRTSPRSRLVHICLR